MMYMYPLQASLRTASSSNNNKSAVAAQGNHHHHEEACHHHQHQHYHDSIMFAHKNPRRHDCQPLKPTRSSDEDADDAAQHDQRRKYVRQRPAAWTHDRHQHQQQYMVGGGSPEEEWWSQLLQHNDDDDDEFLEELLRQQEATAAQTSSFFGQPCSSTNVSNSKFFQHRTEEESQKAALLRSSATGSSSSSFRWAAEEFSCSRASPQQERNGMIMMDAANTNRPTKPSSSTVRYPRRCRPSLLPSRSLNSHGDNDDRDTVVCIDRALSCIQEE